LGVAGVEETGKSEVLVGAVEEVEAVGARGTGEAIEVGDVARAGKVVRGAEEAIEVGDAVEAGDVARAMELIEYMEAGEVGCAVGEVKVVGIVAAGARNSNMATASAAEIFEVIQSSSLP
jgi:hypothetical protein